MNAVFERDQQVSTPYRLNFQKRSLGACFEWLVAPLAPLL